MSAFIQDAARSPGGMGDNRYVKTSEYQVVKVLRKIITLLAVAFSAIVRLLIDVFKGILGRN